MGTRSHIYVETAGGYVGSYCQFDGYPEHMFEQVNKRSHNELYGILLKATVTGGFASLTDEGADYFPGRGEPCFLLDPRSNEENSHISYVYVKRRDGTTVYRHGGAEEGWRQYDPFADREPYETEPL